MNTTKDNHIRDEADKYRGQQLDHLGLVAALYDELEIGEQIDRLIPQDSEKRKVSVGQALKAMILNSLGFANQALYLSSHFFQNKPVERLIGPGIRAEHLNDDLFGRVLDSIYEYGIESLYMQLASRAVNQLGLSGKYGHLDSTSFHTDGQYNCEAEEGVIEVTKGYSRDKRPELNQVVLQLICEQQAGIPLLMQSLSGNNSDKESFRETVNSFVAQMREGQGVEYLVADSAFYTAETLKASADLLWISRVPETINLALEQIDKVAPEMIVDLMEDTHRRVEVEYAGIKQRWLVVYSPQAYQRACKTVDKKLSEQSEAEHKKFAKLCRQAFACETDARNSLQAFEKTLKVTTVAQADIECIAHYEGKGRPAKDRQPDSYTYQIKGHLQDNEHERIQRVRRKSCFIIATNQLDDQALPDEELLNAYKKGQQCVERGFRFLKDPMFMASTLFLKSPKRIMALMMVMTLALLIYAALQYRIRQTLKKHNATFPNQKGKLIDNPTARWVFQFFMDIQVLIIDGVKEIVLNLNAHHKQLLTLLGQRYLSFYQDSS